jgi:hypothetical protein
MRYTFLDGSMPVVVKGWLVYTSMQPRKEGAMSVLVLFRWEGDPDELLAAYDREFEHPVPREQPQRISHTCARAEDGVVIVDVWQSRDDFQKMMIDPEFQKNLEAAGWPSQPQLVEVYEVHASIP